MPLTIPESAFLLSEKYGQLTEQDFTLFAAYFDEKKNRNMCFSIEDVKRYYAEARRSLPKNPSMSLNRLAEKGYIMDAATADEGKSGKCYMLTEAGIAFIETYVPKRKLRREETSHQSEKVNLQYFRNVCIHYG